MSGHGGRRSGAGRKPGVATAKTREIANKAASEGITPLEYLLSVMRDVGADDGRRLDAAKAAAPYIHPRLQPVDGDGDTTQKTQVKGALVWQPPQ
jgi:hypothetical protein